MLTHWQAHKQRLGAYIAQHLDDPSAVDDILQDIYLKAHEKLHSLKVEAALGAWLYRIAHNAIMDYYRQQRPLDELPESLQAPEPDEAVLAHQELARCLTPLIDELPEQYRLPIQMSEIQGLTQKDVARELGLSISGTKSRIQRGRRQLHRRLTACCDIEIGQGGVQQFQRKDSACKDC